MVIINEFIQKMFRLPQASHPERLWALAHIPEDAKVIYDLGCSTNKTLDKAIGVDLKPIADLVASIDDLPMIESGSVDVIISRHSLEHILDSVKTLKEWQRILKSGGIIILELPDHGSIDTMDMVLSGGVHLHAFTMDSLKNLLSFFPELIITKIEPVIGGWSFGAIIKKQ